MPFRARCNPARLIARRHARVHQAFLPPINTRSTLAYLPATVRYSSSDSVFAPLTSFFSRQRRPSPSSAQADFLDALSSNRIESLTISYQSILNDPSPSTLLSSGQLSEAMKVSSVSYDGLSLLQRIYNDIPPIFGYPLETEHHLLLLEGLLNAGLIEEALSFGETLEPNIVDWRRIMIAANDHNPSLMGEVAERLRTEGVLRPSDYTVLIENLQTLPKEELAIRLDDLREEMRANTVDLDIDGQAGLVRVYITLGRLDKAEEIVNGWLTRRVRPPILWNAIVDYDIARKDQNALENTLRNMKEAGHHAPQRSVSYLSSSQLSSSIDSRASVGIAEIVGAIEHAEKICGVMAGSEVWAELIRLYLGKVRQQDALDVALKVYDEARGRGVEVSAELAKNIIVPLCNARKSQRLNEAMRIYDDWMSIPSSSSSEGVDGRGTTNRQRKFGGVYHYLLLACARNQPPAVTTAIRLLNDMRIQKLEITSTNLTSLLVLLMRSTTNHQSAFNIYAHFYALNPRAIDESGFTAILTAYLGLSWDESPFAPPDLFIAMMKDMQKAGYSPGSHILSSLLKQYGQQATKLRRSKKSSTTSQDIDIYNQIEWLGQSIRDIHTLIKLDPLISPDIPLLTSLMDAYARSGAYSETFEVFDELIERRPREPKENLKKSYAAAINVILDACGWSYSLGRARKIWVWANKWNLNWERRHWDSWVECLARNDQLLEASSVVLEQMGMGVENVPKADVETVKILMKFVRKEIEESKFREKRDQAEKIREKVKERWPEWWDQVGTGSKRR